MIDDGWIWMETCMYRAEKNERMSLDSTEKASHVDKTLTRLTRITSIQQSSIFSYVICSNIHQVCMQKSLNDTKKRSLFFHMCYCIVKTSHAIQRKE